MIEWIHICLGSLLEPNSIGKHIPFFTYTFIMVT